MTNSKLQEFRKRNNQTLINQAQEVVDSLVAESPTVEEFIAIVSEDLKEFLGHIHIRNNGVVSAADDDAPATLAADEDEDDDALPGSTAATEKKEKTVEKKGTRQYTTFTDEDRAKHYRRLYKIVTAKAKGIDIDGVRVEFAKKYPDVKPWTVQKYLKLLVNKKHLSASHQLGTKALLYQTGKKPF